MPAEGKEEVKVKAGGGGKRARDEGKSGQSLAMFQLVMKQIYPERFDLDHMSEIK